jgi:hypothetical protein
MKTKYLSILLAAAIAPAIAWADDQRKDTDTSPKEKEGSSSNVSQQQQAAVPNGEGKFEGQITAVDPANKTITITDAQNASRIIQVMDNTKGFNGAEATNWKELNVGATVKGAYHRDGEKYVAETLSINR